MLNDNQPYEVTLPSGLPNFLTVSEVAEIIRFSLKTIYRRINAGLLPAIDEGGRFLIDAETIRALLIVKLAKPQMKQVRRPSSLSAATLTTGTQVAEPQELSLRLSNVITSPPAIALGRRSPRAVQAHLADDGSPSATAGRLVLAGLRAPKIETPRGERGLLLRNTGPKTSLTHQIETRRRTANAGEAKMTNSTCHRMQNGVVSV